MADCAAPQAERVAPENMTSGAGVKRMFFCFGRMSDHTSSFMPTMAATNWPIWSDGAPVWRVVCWRGACSSTVWPPPRKLFSISAPPIRMRGSMPSA